MLCVLSAERDSSFSMYISETVACKFPQSKSAARADSGRRVPWPPLALHTLLLLLPTTTAATTAGATSDAFADTSTTVSASPPGQKEPKRELKGAKAVQGLSWQRPRSQIFILLQLCSLLDFCESAIFLQVESAFWVDCSSSSCTGPGLSALQQQPKASPAATPASVLHSLYLLSLYLIASD